MAAKSHSGAVVQAVHAFGGSVTARHVAALKHMERWPTLVAKLDRLSHPRHLGTTPRHLLHDQTIEGVSASYRLLNKPRHELTKGLYVRDT